MKTISLFITSIIFLLNTSCGQVQSNSSDKHIVEMLKEFYIRYNHIWSIKPPLASDVLDRKLDSLMQKYCTSKLRNEAKKSLEGDYGQDLMTNSHPGIDSFENLKVEKDINIENSYIVYYTTTDSDASGKPVKQYIVLHLDVVKEGERYKIASVK